jgi:hypothetical protein
VELTRQKPLGRRDLTETGRTDLTLAAAVHQMKRAFAVVAEVVASAERVWNETADGLTEIGTQLAAAKEKMSGLDGEVTSALASAEAELGQLGDLLNSDPLALWQGGRVDTSRLESVRARADVATAKAVELARLRTDARQRISAAHSAVAAVSAARDDADAARLSAAAKIAHDYLPSLPPSEAADLDVRLATLAKLEAAERWARLAADLDTIEAEAADATARYRDAERAAVALLGKRQELRGLLDAYQAKAARLGAAEDIELAAHYQQARELLWAAPCDLAVAAAAVTQYQRAILALNEGRRPQ